VELFAADCSWFVTDSNTVLYYAKDISVYSSLRDSQFDFANVHLCIVDLNSEVVTFRFRFLIQAYIYARTHVTNRWVNDRQRMRERQTVRCGAGYGRVNSTFRTIRSKRKCCKHGGNNQTHMLHHLVDSLERVVSVERPLRLYKL